MRPRNAIFCGVAPFLTSDSISCFLAFGESKKGRNSKHDSLCADLAGL